MEKESTQKIDLNLKKRADLLATLVSSKMEKTLAQEIALKSFPVKMGKKSEADETPKIANALSTLCEVGFEAEVKTILKNHPFENLVIRETKIRTEGVLKGKSIKSWKTSEKPFNLESQIKILSEG